MSKRHYNIVIKQVNKLAEIIYRLTNVLKLQQI